MGYYFLVTCGQLMLSWVLHNSFNNAEVSYHLSVVKLVPLLLITIDAVHFVLLRWLS